VQSWFQGAHYIPITTIISNTPLILIMLVIIRRILPLIILPPNIIPLMRQQLILPLILPMFFCFWAQGGSWMLPQAEKRAEMRCAAPRVRGAAWKQDCTLACFCVFSCFC
jgi:hypothetical protein